MGFWTPSLIDGVRRASLPSRSVWEWYPRWVICMRTRRSRHCTSQGHSASQRARIPASRWSRATQRGCTWSRRRTPAYQPWACRSARASDSRIRRDKPRRAERRTDGYSGGLIEGWARSPRREPSNDNGRRLRGSGHSSGVVVPRGASQHVRGVGARGSCRLVAGGHTTSDQKANFQPNPGPSRPDWWPQTSAAVWCW